MKIKQIVITGTLLVSFASFAQKDELKALKKIYAKDEINTEDLSLYKSLITKVEPIATEEGDKVYTNFYKSMLPALELNSLGVDKTLTPLQIQMKMMKAVNPKSISDFEKGLNATLDYEKKTGKKIYTDDILETIVAFKPQFLNYAILLGKDKKYKESADVLYSIYLLDKKDQENLYYAANYAVNAEDYEKALQFFKELKATNYTGEGTLYYAKNKATGTEENYNDKLVRDKLVSLGTHSSPRDEKIPSKKAEIVKTIALILINQGKSAEAKEAISEARKLNPDDVSLIISEADIYLKLNDTESYKKLINEALAKNPNDKTLLFNLGVTCSNANQPDDAEKYYRKVIEIDPNYTDAYMNLAALLLKPDEKIVIDMNKLSNSAADLKKYDVLKAERVKLFTKVMPILEKAHQLEPKNESAKSNLKSVYSFLELMDKVKALKEE